MTNRTASRELAEVRRFFVLAYAVTWVLLAPWFYAYTVIYQGHVPLWMWLVTPLAFVGGWGPTVSALILAARKGGRAEVRKLLGTATRWRVPVRLYVVTWVLPPLLMVLAIVFVDRGVSTLRQFNAGAALAGLPLTYLLALPFGPLGEELGWRGFALPRLVNLMGPVRASLLLGAVWTFWHVPMMLWFPGASIPSFMPLSALSIGVYFIHISADTALMTYLFMRTRGSVLLTIMAHLTLNTAMSVVYGGLPSVATAQRREDYLVYTALLAVAGLGALICLRRREPLDA